MSNDVVAVPDYLKALMDSGEVGSSTNLISTGSSVPRISLKGQKFRFIKEGEEVDKTGDPINVVILGVQPESGMCKTFYKEGYSSGEDSGPPDCSSTNGIIPDTWISTPASNSCAGCPNNAWGSAKSMSGGKAKACRDSKRLYVIRVAKDTDLAEDEGFILNVTVASLKNLSTYGKHLVQNGVPMEAVITTLTMNDDSDFPMLEFAMAGVLGEKPGMTCINRAKKKEWAELEMDPPPQQEALPDNTTAEEIVVTDSKPAVIEGEAETVETAASDTPSGDVDDILDKWT